MSFWGTFFHLKRWLGRKFPKTIRYASQLLGNLDVKFSDSILDQNWINVCFYASYFSKEEIAIFLWFIVSTRYSQNNSLQKKIFGLPNPWTLPNRVKSSGGAKCERMLLFFDVCASFRSFSILIKLLFVCNVPSTIHP